MKERDISVYIVLLLILSLLTSSCKPDSADDILSNRAEDTPIKIGLITDISGPFVSIGTDIKIATELAVQEINETGGINGSPLEIKIIDTGGNPDQAVIGLRELVDNGVFAVSGPMSSGEAEVIFAQAAQFNIPIMTGTANKAGITSFGDGWAFRNTTDNNFLYGAAMPIWASNYEIKSALLVYDEAQPVTAAAATSAIPKVADSLGITIENIEKPITFVTGQTDFSTVVQRIKEADADGIILISIPEEAGLIARELNRQNETRPILGHPAQNTNSFFEQGGDDINEWILPSIIDIWSSDPKSVDYLAKMVELDPEPPTIPEAANYYDNIMIFANIMIEAKINGVTPPEDARQIIRDGLLTLKDFDGVVGKIAFDGKYDAEKEIFVYVVIDGELKPLE